MTSNLIAILWMVVVELGFLIVLVATFVPANRPRKLSDWGMLAGIALSIAGLSSALALIYLFEPDPATGAASDRHTQFVSSAMWGTAGGYLVFAAAFLLSRFEARSARIHAKQVRSAMDS